MRNFALTFPPHTLPANSLVARTLAALCAVALIVLTPRLAPANTVFSQPVVAGGPSIYSDTEFGVQAADNFSLAAPAIIDSIRWWGTYIPGGPPSTFQVRFFADFGGTPAIVPFSDQPIGPINPTATGLFDVNARPIFEFNSAVPVPVALAGGTPYYLSLLDTTAGSGWAWTADGAGSFWTRNVDGSPWSVAPPPFVNNLAFELNSVTVVPLPAAAWCGLALIGGIGVRRTLVRANPSL
jgi:hypothetical protein